MFIFAHFSSFHLHSKILLVAIWLWRTCTSAFKSLNHEIYQNFPSLASPTVRMNNLNFIIIHMYTLDSTYIHAYTQNMYTQIFMSVSLCYKTFKDRNIRDTIYYNIWYWDTIFNLNKVNKAFLNRIFSNICLGSEKKRCRALRRWLHTLALHPNHFLLSNSQETNSYCASLQCREQNKTL